MNKMRRSRLLYPWLAAAALAAPAAMLAALPVQAASHAQPAQSLAQSNGPTLSQAVEQVRRQYRGRIVSAETRVRGNREVHVIKVLTDDGKVKTVRVNGRTLQGRG